MAASTSIAPPAQLGNWQSAYAITPNDLTFLPWVPDWIYVGSTGDISMAFPGNPGPVVAKSVPVGRWPFHPTRIFATSTTASNILIVKDGQPATPF